MSSLLNGFGKYLLPAALFVLAAFCAYFYFALNHYDTVLLEEKIYDRKFEMNLICDEIDRFAELDNDWGVYDYEHILSYVVEQIDATSGTYAELFRHDMSGISNRTPLFYNAPFDPMKYPEIVHAITQNENGEITVWFDQESVEAHDLHLYYRWIPTDKRLNNRLLVMIGVSKYSVSAKISAWITYGAVALIVVSSLFIVTTIILLCQLGYIWMARKGENKWRKKTYL